MNRSGAPYSELWVCFVPPPAEPPPHALILSFMPPGEEDEIAARLGSRFISARDVAREVHTEARRQYVDLIARIGATPCVNGQSLRQALTAHDGYSRWWFHKVSEKDCGWDEDPTYLVLIRLLCLRHVVNEHGTGRVRFYGAPPEFRAAATGCSSGRLRAGLSVARSLAYGILSRLVFLRFYLRLWWILRDAHVPITSQTGVDIVFEAHWDWSLRLGIDGVLHDRYFRNLPEEVQKRGLRVGWFAWCEPNLELWQRGRSLANVVAPALAHSQVMLLERFLGFSDILFSALRIRYLATFFRFAVSREFRNSFRTKGFDLYPIMRALLIREFAGSGICRREVLLLSTLRACRRLQPRMLLMFLEMFLHSRAMYAGAHLAAKDIQIWACQHGAYSSDKTMSMLDPRVEFHGEPDGCGIMRPDRIYAMGELAEKIWIKSGFRSNQVIVAGGLRYQHVRAVRQVPNRKTHASVLLVCAMTEAWDLEMCAAATLASDGLPIRLRFRDHPSYNVSERRSFARFRTKIEVTTGSVDEDLAATDLVLFTYSGLAEEAVLRGLPVWQWQWAGVMPTVFIDLPVIPAFTSVRALREALQAFVHDPEPFRPTPGVQETVLRACFGPAPAQASARIAEDITGYIRGPGVLTSGFAKAREQ